jgi:hypothetical protein
MWRVNPNAGIDKRQLQVRPFGIIWTQDPNGVAPVEFSDVKPSAYTEETLLKQDMAYATGIDDASRGVQSGGSATEVRHLREATLERLRLFINHLGEGFSTMFRLWISDWRQFMTKEVHVRIVGKDGVVSYPVIQKGDLDGSFDFRAMVTPSIAGKNDVERKQVMDMLQLLMPLSQQGIIPVESLLNWALKAFNVSLDTFKSQVQAEGEQEVPTIPPGSDLEAFLGEEAPQSLDMGQVNAVMAKMGLPPMQQGGQNAFNALNRPVSLDGKSMPPAAPDTTNPRGLSRGPGAKVNTALPANTGASDAGSRLLSEAGKV